MRLGINGWRLQGPRTGVRRYLHNVVRYWTPEVIAGRFSGINCYTPVPLDRQDTPLPDNIQERVLLPHCRMLLWENLCFAPAASDDVIFCPSFSRPLLARGKTVVTTHEASSKDHPELFPLSVRLFYNHLYGWSARHATLVIADSEASRQDIARCWRVPLARIRVVYMASDTHFRPLPADPRVADARHLGASTPFFLFVGKMSGRRNIPLLLESFAHFKRHTSFPHRLVLVGLNIHALDLSSFLERFGLAGDVTHRPYVTDEDLNLLYNAADALISPSSYETVCLPVMEAQATATPVICIDTAGMREITGGAAVLMPTLDVKELVEAMSRIASDVNLRRELGDKGLANARRFSWEQTSRDTLAVLEEALGLPAPSP